MDDIKTKVIYPTVDGGYADYDPKNMPNPMPSIDLFKIELSWDGGETLHIPANWPQEDIVRTIQSHIDAFNQSSTAKETLDAVLNANWSKIASAT